MNYLKLTKEMILQMEHNLIKNVRSDTNVQYVRGVNNFARELLIMFDEPEMGGGDELENSSRKKTVYHF